MNDEEAFAAFYDRTSGGLWRYLRRLAGDEATAQDLLQESYVKLLGVPESQMPAGAFSFTRSGRLRASGEACRARESAAVP